GEESHRVHQAPGSRRRGQPGAPRGPRAGPARREHHGVLQAVQCAHAGSAGNDHSRRDHRVRGPLLHVHHQDAPGGGADQEGHRPGQGLRLVEEDQGGHAHAGAAAHHRRNQDARPERGRHRGRHAPDRRHRPVDGRRGSRCV
ncbi:MAG: LSU ribosomal protein L11p (L12e), partial [uncultured Gemmatimonadetes bacterium]